MAARQPRYAKKEAARRGDEIYDTQIRQKLTPEDHGKYVAIDIESGQWEMDADRRAAGDRLLARVPDAQMWMDRVGYRYVVRFRSPRLISRLD